MDFENTIQDLGEDLFTDLEETMEETAEETTEAEESEETAPQTEEPKYKVKYNGEEMELPVSQLVINAQKGMNYDKIKSEYEALKSTAKDVDAYKAEIHALDEIAKQFGFTREELIMNLETQRKQIQMNTMIENGMPVEYAKELMVLKQRELERAEIEKSLVDNEKNAYIEFVKEYPDVTELPEEVIKAIYYGETPLSAMRAYENKQLKLKLEALNNNNKNKELSIGSVKSSSALAEDAFLSGFDI